MNIHGVDTTHNIYIIDFYIFHSNTQRSPRELRNMDSENQVGTYSNSLWGLITKNLSSYSSYLLFNPCPYTKKSAVSLKSMVGNLCQETGCNQVLFLCLVLTSNKMFGGKRGRLVNFTLISSFISPEKIHFIIFIVKIFYKKLSILYLIYFTRKIFFLIRVQPLILNPEFQPTLENVLLVFSLQVQIFVSK